jgi:TrmH family RNA methyltransferase
MDGNPFERLRVVLVAPRNPLNIGAAARAMSNFGCAHLHLVNPYDPSFREARSAVGASSVLAEAQVHTTVAAAVADCALVVGTTAVGAREVLHPLHALPQAAPLLRQAMHSAQTALLFGSEKTGLTKADLSHCHWLLRIPTQPTNYSMNLGQAVAVCLYALATADAQSEAPSAPLMAQSSTLAPQEMERLLSVLMEVLHHSQARRMQSDARYAEHLRRLLLRLNPGRRDAQILLGMLRRVLWRLQQK